MSAPRRDYAYWIGFVVAAVVTATTWRVFDRATIAAAYAVRQPDNLTT